MVNSELSDVVRLEVIETFWDIPQDKEREDAIPLESYFGYFQEQIRLARQNDDSSGQICSQTTICSIVRRLKAKQHRDIIKKELALEIHCDEENYSSSIDNAIDVASRLWLMVHIGNVGRGVTGQTAINWHQGCLQKLIVKHFKHQLVLTDTVKFEKVFNLRNIERIAGVVIQWTPNLVDHLRLKEDGKIPVLNVFHHASFLEYHKYQYDAPGSFFPEGLVDETLRTLALLLPTHDQETRRWFRKQRAKLGLDPRARECGQLKLEDRQIDHFKYWHDRLVILKQFFDDSKPRTIKQWWFDDRKRVQWFWVAIFLVFCTVLFGLIQCFEGGWQIWKAYH